MIREINTILIDEHINEYQPSSHIKDNADRDGEPVPAVFIPRKPHPNGLLIYVATSYIISPVSTNTKIPYMVDFCPHFQVRDINATLAIQKFIERYVYNKVNINILYFSHHLINKPHIIADSAFGTTENITTIKNWGGKFTLSIKSDTFPWLWNVLAHGLMPNHWRSALLQENLVASIHCIIDEKTKKIATKQIITNAFQGTEVVYNNVNTSQLQQTNTIGNIHNMYLYK